MAENDRMKGGFSENGYTIGIGLTDRCNAKCAHCYSRSAGDYQDLDFDQVLRLVDAIPVKSVNFGTGESILYPRFIEIIQKLFDRDIPTAITTNGSTIMEMCDDDLRRLHDVDFSIDFPDEQENDSWRGEGSYKMALDGARRCLDLGVETSLVACLMKQNSRHMGNLAEMAAQLGFNLRVNVYKSVFTREYQPDYNEFWGAIEDMASTAYFTACSEPIVNAVAGNSKPLKGNPCGQMSFRVHPDGKIVSCVYLKESDITIEDLIANFDDCRNRLACAINLPLPEICKKCDHVSYCNGGCASRRILNQPDQPDEYCFVVRNDRPTINARWKKSTGLVHEDYLCTMIFSG